MTARTLYGFWWLASAVPVIGAAVLPRGILRDADGWTVAVRLAFLGLPFVSIVAHLCGASWVYDTGFWAANLAPVLLGLAVVAPRVLGRVRGEPVRLALPMLALVVSISTAKMGGQSLLNLDLYSPLHLATVVAGLVYLWHAWEYRRPLLAMLVALGGTVYLLGRVPRNVWWEIERFIVNAANFAGSLLPRTALHWVLLTLFGAFAMLGIGLIVSLKKPPLQRAAIDDRLPEN